MDNRTQNSINSVVHILRPQLEVSDSFKEKMQDEVQLIFGKIHDFHDPMSPILLLTIHNRFHRMDCVDIFRHNLTSVPDINPFEFLQQIKLHTPTIIKKYISETKNARDLRESYSKRFFQSKYPVTEQDVREFIFGHWVLVQLPFEPALLHQWLAIVMVRVLEIHKMLICGSSILQTMTKDRNKVERLYVLAKNLAENMQFCFRWLQRKLEQEHDAQDDVFYDKTKLQKADPILLQKIQNILATLETLEGQNSFLQTADVCCREYAFERTDTHSRWTKHLYELEECWTEFCNMHTPDFWLRENSDWIFAPANGATKIEKIQMPYEKDNQAEKLHKYKFLQYLSDMFLFACSCKTKKIDLPEFHAFLNEIGKQSSIPNVQSLGPNTDCNELIGQLWINKTTNRLKAKRKTKIEAGKYMKELTNTAGKIEAKINYWLKRTAFYKVLRDNAFTIGVCLPGRILAAYSDFQIALSQEHIMVTMMSVVKHILPRSVYCPSNNETVCKIMCSEDFEELIEFSKKLQQQKPLNKKMWRYEAILKRAREECALMENSVQPKHLNLDLDDPRNIERTAKSFEVRIKKMVISMIEHQFPAKEEEMKYYPERQIVQYLLPHAVARFMDFCTVVQWTPEEKTRYLKFVDDLISEYEKSPIELEWIGNPQGSIDVITYFFRRDNLLNNFSRKYFNLPCFSRHEVDGYLEGQYLDYLHSVRSHSLDFGIVEPVLWSVCCNNFRLKSHKILLSLDKYRQINWNLRTFIELIEYKINSFCPNAQNVCYPISNYVTDVQFSPYECDLALQFIVYELVNTASHTPECTLQQSVFPVKHWVPRYEALWCLLTGDRWKLKQLISTWLNGPNREDVTSVPYKTVISNPKIYGDIATKLVTPEGKVKMEHPGEITFFPIKHCRWCGKVDCPEFRVCRECREQKDYPDVNIFCSEKCENEALEDVHREEHVRRLFELISI